MFILRRHAPCTSNRPPNWDALIARLRQADGIEASLVGFVYAPSRQYALYEAVIARGSRDQFLQLTHDEHPVLRCVGLLALARTDGRRALPTLRKHLCDRQWVRHQVYDMGDAMTVGEFALRLLHDPNALVVDNRRGNSSLLSEAEWRCLHLEILADAVAVSLHDSVASELSRAVGRRKLALDLPSLRPQAPTLADWQIIKAIGRIRLLDPSRRFLVVCMESHELNPQARLAAASALTRHTDVECARALRHNRVPLNGIEGEAWGDFFVEMLNTRRTHERNIRPVLGKRSWPQSEHLKKRLLTTLTCDHPLVLDNLIDVSSPFLVGRYPDVNDAVSNALVAISANLAPYSQPWSTYADAAFKLDLLVRARRIQEREDERLKAEASHRLQLTPVSIRTLSEPNGVPLGLKRLQPNDSKLPVRTPQATAEHTLLNEEQCARIENNIRPFDPLFRGAFGPCPHDSQHKR